MQGEEDTSVEMWDPDSEDEVSETGASCEIPYVQSRLIRWYAVVLFTFQFLFSLSDTALHYLFKFFSTFISLVASALPSSGLLTFSRNLPKTLDTARKIAKTRYDFYKVFAACPKCNKVYKLSQCITRNRNGLETSKSCTYVEFPSHPWVTLRAPCGETLMKSVKSSSGKIFLYPRLSFCYLPLVDSLAIVLPRIKANLNHWKSRSIPRGLMADVYDGDVWKEFISFMDKRSSSVCLSLTLNVDWFEPYKYVKHSIGAMYVVINNLPRHLRFKASNVILVGLMPGPDLPYNINHYLSPLVDELKELAIGVSINGEVVRGMLSCIANDVPAARKCVDLLVTILDLDALDVLKCFQRKSLETLQTTQVMMSVTGLKGRMNK